MEAFHLLSRGGVKFDKQKYRDDVKLFNKSSASNKNIPSTQGTKIDHLPAELDFFKYTQGAGQKRKSQSEELGGRKKRRKQDSDSGAGEDEGDQSDTGSIVGAEEQPATQRHQVKTKGLNVPSHFETFEELRTRYSLPSHISSNLEKYGYAKPTSVQSYAIPILLENRDLAAISPTGTGKTLSYLLPTMIALGSPNSKGKKDFGSGARALIIAPTRELAHQIHNECLKLAEGRKWRMTLFSKATASTLADKNVRDKVDIIISTPLRLVTSLQQGHLDLSNVRHLILDEADRMLDSEFLGQIEEIIAACSHPDVQKAVFSATLPANAEKVAFGVLRDPIRVVVGLKDTPLPSIAQSLTYVADDSSKLPTLLTHLSQPYKPPVLVFTSTQPRASSLAEELVINGIPNVDCLHAGMTKKEREDAIGRMRRGQSWVMISTEVMARGMDFRGVMEVINYDFPQSVQSYIHRIGRTGRAGREGKAVTYFTNDDTPFLKPIANVLLQSGSPVPGWVVKLPKPSKMKRRQMGRVKRPDVVNKARSIGRNQALRKRDMIEGSKRRKVKEERKATTETES